MHSTLKRALLASAAAMALAAAPTSSAAPTTWEPDFGPEIEELTGLDDATEAVSLSSFAFPFEGHDYTTIHVGTNGCVQLGALGYDGDIDYDMYYAFEEFYADSDGDEPPYPLLCPFNSDLDLTSDGTIHFHEFPDRAVITWNEVGTNEVEEHHVTFQIQLREDGTIVFAWNGILDGPDEDLYDSLYTGIVVGVTASRGDFPNPEDDPFDLSQDIQGAADTVYQRWCGEDPDTCYASGAASSYAGGANRDFDLDGYAVTFVPRDGGGFDTVAKSPAVRGAPELWESAIGDSLEALADEDDATAEVTLGFAFPFGDFSYTTVHVGTNGCMQLGTLGADGSLSYSLWNHLEEFFEDDDGDGDPEPVLCPFGSDFDLRGSGSIHFNDRGDHAVFTWREVTPYDNDGDYATFQAILHADGRIVYSWNGIFDGTGESPLVSLSQGIVVGFSQSTGAVEAPETNPFDLDASFEAGLDIYQRWCFDTADTCGTGGVDLGWAGATNDAFHLDNRSVLFTPLPGGGFAVQPFAGIFSGGFETPLP